MQTPVMVLNTNTQRETGRRAQMANIGAAKVRRPRARARLLPPRAVLTRRDAAPPRPLPPRAVADIIRTTLGPKSMLKMLLDPMGGIVITNGAGRAPDACPARRPPHPHAFRPPLPRLHPPSPRRQRDPARD